MTRAPLVWAAGAAGLLAAGFTPLRPPAPDGLGALAAWVDRVGPLTVAASLVWTLSVLGGLYLTVVAVAARLCRRRGHWRTLSVLERVTPRPARRLTGTSLTVSVILASSSLGGGVAAAAPGPTPTSGPVSPPPALHLLTPTTGVLPIGVVSPSPSTEPAALPGPPVLRLLPRGSAPNVDNGSPTPTVPPPGSPTSQPTVSPGTAPTTTPAVPGAVPPTGPPGPTTATGGPTTTPSTTTPPTAAPTTVPPAAAPSTAGVAPVSLAPVTNTPPTGPTSPIPTATTPTGTTSPASDPSPATWTIRPGDSLWLVAEETLTEAWGQTPGYAALASYWWTVVQTNQQHLPDPANPDLVFPGDAIVLPPPPAPPS